ncbi:sugar nucleotide-binding protein [Candidatus Pelagibacter sp.]|jgi:dTDP-4-dehydrorhamnose reductase|nr:sugar nucleotide-binding protein [Candidatus Pelagibacter sp.]
MKNFDFLVIGSNGLLGSNIVKILKKKKINFLTVAKKNSNFNINLENFKRLDKFFLKNKFKIVINCAAIIDINYCEKKYNISSIINSKLVKFLSQMSKKFDFKFVQISTDQVYKGKNAVLNSEKSKIFAINKYAKSKILAEKYLKELKKFLIIRTNFTGRKKNSFIDWLIRNFKKKAEINLFNDMYTSTMDVQTCAKTIIKLAMLKSKGIYNLGSRNMITKENFAKKMSKILKIKIKYKSISSDIQQVSRGKNLGLNVKKIEKKIGYKMPTSSQSIINLLKEYQ